MPVAPGLRSSGWISGNKARVGSKKESSGSRSFS